MRYSTVLFGGIGTMVETSDLQLDAFNQAFTNLGIDFVWDRQAYADSLVEAGGRHRLSKLQLADGQFLSEQAIANVHAEKTRLFDKRILADGLTLRAGVADTLARAAKQHTTLGWVTTTSTDNIEAICRAVGQPLTLDRFAYVGDAQKVDNSKPAPDIYADALAALEIDSASALAIEDSPTGVAAAKAAGLFVVAFPGQMHAEHDFGQADERVDSLADIASLIGNG